MAALASLPVAAYASAASTVLTAGLAYTQGQAQKRNSEMQAAQRLEDAKAAQADSIREANIKRRQGQYAMSRARAIAGASGAGSSDPTVQNILTSIDTESEVDALNSLYSGNTLARGLRAGARASRREGNAYSFAGSIGAATRLVDGGTSWAEKYA